MAYTVPMSRTEDIRIRVSPDEREVIDRAVARSGLTLSAWVRLLLLRAARDDTKEVASA